MLAIHGQQQRFNDTTLASFVKVVNTIRKFQLTALQQRLECT
jgi:hypothetical protein